MNSISNRKTAVTVTKDSITVHRTDRLGRTSHQHIGLVDILGVDMQLGEPSTVHMNDGRKHVIPASTDNSWEYALLEVLK